MFVGLYRMYQVTISRPTDQLQRRPSCQSNRLSRYTAVWREVDEWQIVDAVVTWRQRLTDSAQVTGIEALDREHSRTSWRQAWIRLVQQRQVNVVLSGGLEWRSLDRSRSKLLVPVTSRAAAEMQLVCRHFRRKYQESVAVINAWQHECMYGYECSWRICVEWTSTMSNYPQW